MRLFWLNFIISNFIYLYKITYNGLYSLNARSIRHGVTATRTGISFRHIEHVVGSNLLGNVIMRIIPASYILLR